MSYTRFIDLVRDLKNDEKVNKDKNIEWQYFALNKNIFDSDINEDLNSENPLFNKFLYSGNRNLQITTVLQFCKPEELYGYEGEHDYWNWQRLSSTLGTHNFQHYPDLPWVHGDMVVDIATTIRYKYDWPLIQIAKKTPVDIVYNYKHLEIFEHIFYCPDITIRWIKNHPDINQKIEDQDEDGSAMYILSEKINIDEIQSNIDMKWSYTGMAYNPTLTAEFVLNHLTKYWPWLDIFNNKNVNIETFFAHKEWNYIKNQLKKDLEEISLWALNRLSLEQINTYFDRNTLTSFLDLYIYETFPFTMEILSKYTNNYTYFSNCKHLKIKDIINNIDEKWNWEALSRNSSFTVADIEYGLTNGAKWDWDSIAHNPNLTYDFIWKYRHKIKDWKAIFSNDFEIEYKRRLQRIKNEISEDTTKVDVLSNIIMEY